MSRSGRNSPMDTSFIRSRLRWVENSWKLGLGFLGFLRLMSVYLLNIQTLMEIELYPLLY